MFCLQISLWTVTILILGFILPALGASLKCYKGSIENFFSTPLNRPLGLMDTPCIDRALPTVVYTFGYRGRREGPATKAVLEAYIATRKRNVLLLDWEHEARSGLFGIPLGYMWYAVPNAKRVGKDLGDSLVKLARAGLNMTHVHLVGHSLGAHIMGYAGRRTRESGYIVPRITGLDPARALFEGRFALQAGLDRTCARFVDIVHSDAGGYGTSQPSGSVDIWPNYVGEAGSQPGCPQGDYEMFTPEDLCSHDRAWRYYVEAVGAPTSFLVVGAANYEGWIARAEKPTQTFYLGELMSTRARGNYYFTTNSQSPFSKGKDGLRADANQVRRRRRNSSLTKLLKYFR